MIDSKLAGTGNSRFLKSVSNFKTLYPTYDDFVAALIAGTLPIDLNGINPDGWTQQGTPLNKANLLSDDVANGLGLVDDATPNGAFNAIISAKGKSNGFATLDSSGKVPSGQLPSMDYIPTSQKGAAGGVATLGSSGKVPSSQLDLSSSVTRTSTTTAANSYAVKQAYDKAASASTVTTGSGLVADGGHDNIQTIETNSVTWRKVGNIVFVTVDAVIVYSSIYRNTTGVTLSFRVKNLPEMESNSCVAIAGGTAVKTVGGTGYNSADGAYCNSLYNSGTYVNIGVLFPAYAHSDSISDWITNPTEYQFKYTVTIIGFAK